MQPGGGEPQEDVLEGHVGGSWFLRISHAWLVRLVVVLAVLAAGAIGAAAHYRSGAAEAGRSAPTATTSSGRDHTMEPAGESLRVANARLPVLGSRQPGFVVVIHGSAGPSRTVVIDVEILGLRHGHRYKLIGNDCRAKVPDYVWAAGRADKFGTLHLATIPRELDTTHVYWVSLFRPRALVEVGVFGTFATGAVMPFQGGHGPCSL